MLPNFLLEEPMKSKNISILFPKSQFSEIQLERLAVLGKVTFNDCPKDTEVLVFSPEVTGSVGKARIRLWQILTSLPNIKYLVLGSSDCSFVDLNYCKQKGIIVSHIPQYDAESRAEHIIALILACSRRIVINDRRTYRRKYQPEPGFEIRGKRLGVIGLGPTVEKAVLLARAIGMTVYAEERFEGAIRKPLDFLLSDSDFLTLYLPDNERNKKFLNKEKINKIKRGTILVNVGNREWVDETAMNNALIDKRIDTYCFESESMGKSPLKNNEYAIMLKPFSTYTKETMERNIEAMVNNIDGIARGKPYNKLDF